jgi:hypothetical protein
MKGIDHHRHPHKQNERKKKRHLFFLEPRQYTELKQTPPRLESKQQEI